MSNHASPAEHLPVKPSAVNPAEWHLTKGELPAFPKDATALWNAWLEEGREKVNGLFWAGRQVQLFSSEAARMTRMNHVYGDGGDRSQRMTWKIERLHAGGSITAHFNADLPLGEPESAFRVTLTPEEISVWYREQPVASLSERQLPGTTSTLEFVTLDRSYQFLWNGRVIAKGNLKESRDKEGWTQVAVKNAGVTLCNFEERLLTENPDDAPRPQRGELLYTETFSAESLAENWTMVGSSVVASDQTYRFAHMSLAVLKKRFDGPIIVEAEIEPLSNPFVSAGVTDAIILWMLDHPREELFDYLQSLPDARRHRFDHLPFYWLDIGGTNNATTRFRKSPSLWLLRQLASQDRLLEKGSAMRLEIVQHGAYTRLRVNDEPWFDYFDRNPLREGHIGFRGFSGGAPSGTPTFQLTYLKIWKAKP